jgi:hypothetical protein
MKGNSQVYICAEGTNADHSPTENAGWPAKYHTTDSCPALLSRTVRATRFLPDTRKMNKDEAERLGWKPCKRCHI